MAGRSLRAMPPRWPIPRPPCTATSFPPALPKWLNRPPAPSPRPDRGGKNRARTAQALARKAGPGDAARLQGRLAAFCRLGAQQRIWVPVPAAPATVGAYLARPAAAS